MFSNVLFQSLMPIYIRNLHYDGSMLELAADGTGVEYNPLDESRSENQQWYIKYLTGLRDGMFMIISKKNGKALQIDHAEVKAVECDEQEQCQQWRRHGLHIQPVEQHVSNATKMLYVKKKSVLVLVTLLQ